MIPKYTIEKWREEINQFKQELSKINKNVSVIEFDAIESTNDYLKENLHLPNYSIAIAYEQTKGKGQRKRKWISNPGGLYFSIIFKFKEDKPIEPFWIIAKLSIYLISYLKNEFGVTFNIKWPNDILFENKKISGILSESLLSKQDFVLIIGVGINIYNDLNEIYNNAQLQGGITSLSSLTTKEIQFHKLLLSIYQKLLKTFETGPPNFIYIKNQWLALNPIIGKKVKVFDRDTNELLYLGVITDITKFGSLLLKENNGAKVELTSGNILIVENSK